MPSWIPEPTHSNTNRWVGEQESKCHEPTSPIFPGSLFWSFLPAPLPPIAASEAALIPKSGDLASFTSQSFNVQSLSQLRLFYNQKKKMLRMRLKAFEKFSAPSQEDSSALTALPTETVPPSDLAQMARIQGWAQTASSSHRLSLDTILISLNSTFLI